MKASVSLTEKKCFLRWFLKSHTLKKREGRWILNYLLEKEQALNNVKFIQHAEFCPRGLYLSGEGEKGSALMFYKGAIRTTDGEKSFHDIRMNVAEPIYLELDYKNSRQCSRLALVKEENPFLPVNYYVNQREKSETGEWLDFQLMLKQRELLISKIDKALEEKDKALFNQLSKQYTELDKRIKEQGI